MGKHLQLAGYFPQTSLGPLETHQHWLLWTFQGQVYSKVIDVIDVPKSAKTLPFQHIPAATFLSRGKVTILGFTKDLFISVATNSTFSILFLAEAHLISQTIWGSKIWTPKTNGWWRKFGSKLPVWWKKDVDYKTLRLSRLKSIEYGNGSKPIRWIAGPPHVWALATLQSTSTSLDSRCVLTSLNHIQL